MGITDFGNQTILFDYGQVGRSKSFNKLNYGLFPTGIYSGGALSKYDANTVGIAVLNCFIHDSDNLLGVRIQTTETAYIDVTTTTPYVILRFSWSDVDNNYMDMLALAYDDILDDDLIVGKCIFSGATLQSTFDSSRRSEPILSDLKTNEDKLRVLPKEPYSDMVAVNAGELITIDGRITVKAQTSTAISPTTDGRIDIVYIDDSGLITVEEGVDAASPSVPSYGNKKVIAEIIRGASRSNIRGSDIVLVDASKRADSYATTFIRTLLDDLNAATARSTLSAEKEITVSISEPTGEDGSDGDIWFTREA